MEIAIIIGLILLNGIFSMAEISLVSARKSRLEGEAKRGNKSALTALKLANEPDRFFSTTQIGITLIGILTGLYSGEAFAGDLAVVVQKIPALSPYAFGISKTIIVIIVTYLTLVFGELVPKRIGMNKAEHVAKTIARPMILLSRIASPFVWLLSKSTSLMMKMIGVNIDPDSKVTEEEIKALIKEGYEVGEVQEVEHDIMGRVLGLGNRNVGSIMTHRSELVLLDIADSNDYIKAQVKKNLFNTYPVSSKKVDNIIGVVHLKDLFGEIDSSDFSINKFIRPAIFLPENKSVYSALEQIKGAHERYGIVVDEFGSLLGIVTLKDIIEALIGEVPEQGRELDIVEREDGSCLVDGQCSFYTLLEHFHMEYLYAGNDYNTLSGLILDVLKNIPLTGQKLTWHNLHFEIVDMDGARIDKVLVTVR